MYSVAGIILSHSNTQVSFRNCGKSWKRASLNGRESINNFVKSRINSTTITKSVYYILYVSVYDYYVCRYKTERKAFEEERSSWQQELTVARQETLEQNNRLTVLSQQLAGTKARAWCCILNIISTVFS